MPNEAKKMRVNRKEEKEKLCPKCKIPLKKSGYPEGAKEAGMLQCKRCGRLYDTS